MVVLDIPAGSGQFAQLKRMLLARRAFEPQPGFYVSRVCLNGGLLAASLAGALMADGAVFRAASAILMAFAVGQIAMVGHDAGHNQLFRSARTNRLAGLLLANLFVGISFGFWVHKHNRHHARPNQLGFDPDIDMKVHAYCDQQLQERPPLIRPLVRYQALLLFPLFVFESLSLKYDGLAFLARHRRIVWWKTEWALLLLGHAGLAALLWWAMDLGGALAFYAIQQAALGLYLGLLFAPNHLGMPILPADTPEDFLSRQLTTARNLRPHPLTEYVWGPLAYQIEHHLFPRIPLNRLREARSIVKPFCEASGLPYHEVGVVASFAEILRALHRASAPLRRPGT